MERERKRERVTINKPKREKKEDKTATVFCQKFDVISASSNRERRAYFELNSTIKRKIMKKVRYFKNFIFFVIRNVISIKEPLSARYVKIRFYASKLNENVKKKKNEKKRKLTISQSFN